MHGIKELRTEDESRVGGSASLVEPRATAPAVLPDAGASLFERLARDPNCDPDKLERLMAMWERTEALRAEAAFNVAMSAAQHELRPVAADAENPQTRSRYASYAALDRAIRPVYTQHGFALSYDTGDSPLPDHLRVICYVTQSGHKRTYRVDMPADGKGAKGGDVMTKTHATGAAMSYGQRYLLKLIFNIAVGEDADGNSVSRQVPATQAPDGFDDWWTDLSAVADNGVAALEHMWQAANKHPKTKVYLAYATKNKGRELNALKAKAGRVAAS